MRRRAEVLKHREGIIIIGKLQEELNNNGVTSRQVAKRAIAEGYLETPMDERHMREVWKCIYDLKEYGNLRVVGKKSRSYLYKLTENKGKSYYNHLKKIYADFPPNEV